MPCSCGHCSNFQFRAARLHPTQDKLYLIGVVKLPEGASLEAYLCRGAEGERHHPAYRRRRPCGLFCWFNPSQYSNTPNYGVAFAIWKPFRERSRSASRSSTTSNRRSRASRKGFVFVLNPPPILGLGNGAAIRRSSRTAAARATARCSRQWARCRAPVMKAPAWGSRSAAISPTCRSSM